MKRIDAQIFSCKFSLVLAMWLSSATIVDLIACSLRSAGLLVKLLDCEQPILVFFCCGSAYICIYMSPLSDHCSALDSISLLRRLVLVGLVCVGIYVGLATVVNTLGVAVVVALGVIVIFIVALARYFCFRFSSHFGQQACCYSPCCVFYRCWGLII